MKNFFNFKLYLEGLKKIKLVGIIVGIITVVLNALVPLVNLMNVSVEERINKIVTVIDASEFSIPLIVILFLTPFFFLSMFSFLNKRNESDFYHAIPYKRGCVLGSFVAAIYTWILAIIVCSTLCAAVLWWINPTTTFSLSILPLTLGVYFAASLYIGAFILLAMTLSGTIVSNITVAIIALFSFRILGALITATLEELVPMFDIAYSVGKVFSFRYWLPTAVINSFFDTTVFSNAFLWVYSAVVTVGVYALAAFCYCTRKSESAGRSAPGRKLQHVYRILFTLPFALLSTMVLIMDGFDSLFIVCVAITLVVYYLYELITVKNIKSALRSTPLLLVVLACCILFTVGCVGTAKSVYADDYKTNEIESVRLYDYASILDLFDSDSNNYYESIVTEEVQIPDEQARKIVSEALAYTIDYEQGNAEFSYEMDIPMTYKYVEINLTSGGSVGRRIRFTQEQYQELMKALQSSAEYKAAYISLPDEKTINRISIGYLGTLANDDADRLWNTFVKEYNALTDDEKLKYKQNNNGNSDYMEYPYYTEDFYYYTDTLNLEINVYGTMDSSGYYANYSIPQGFSETRKIYFELLEDRQEHVKGYLKDFAQEKTYSEITVANIGEMDWADINVSLCIDGMTYSCGYSFYRNDPYVESVFSGSKNMLTTLLPYLTSEADDDRYCTVYFSASGTENYVSESIVFGLKKMTVEETNALINAVIGDTLIEDPAAVINELSAFSEGIYDSFFADYRYMNYTLSFSFEDEYYTIDNQYLAQHWEKAVEISKQIIELMIPYLSEDLTTDSSVEVSISYNTDKYGTTYKYDSMLGWKSPDAEVKEKLNELLKQLQEVTA